MPLTKTDHGIALAIKKVECLLMLGKDLEQIRGHD